MWKVTGTDIYMTEGDYGTSLPYTARNVTMTADDRMKFTFKKGKNGDTVLTKEYTPASNTVNLEFTAAESALFPAGAYAYTLDWYQHDLFMSCLIENGQFRVGDKA